ncbi:hypothetical protein FOT81_25100 [Raoultella planticola]|nr:hypothetical protein [Raoultella planticola]MBE0094460.1 hypothetical protein [Raoultella planticola]MBZ7833057.1 hypothetical protein [Raoultella planticola]QEU40432.1 hypothetical protein F3X94_03350 [Raoultella planticola]TJZ70879.1 hypothetical protein FA013_05370 [Raoultella planticola]
MPVTQLLLCQFENFRRQHCRARTKVIDLSHFPSPRCYVVCPRTIAGISYSCGYRFYHSVTRTATSKTKQPRNVAAVTQKNLPA